MTNVPLFRLNFKTSVDVGNQLKEPRKSSQPYQWQRDFEAYDGERLVSLSASTGAGKSRAIKVRSWKWNRISQQNKTVIVVPMCQIGIGFRPENIELADGTEIRWSTPMNLCSSDNVIEQVVAFLDSKAVNPDSRTLICSSAAFVMAHNKIEDKSIFKNILFVSDEAHHIATGEDAMGLFSPNGLGSVFLNLIEEESNSILTVTATHFRHDELSIIPSKYKDSFRYFDVPFYRVQDECRQYTKHISFGYSTYKKDLFEGIENSFNPNEKTIIFIHPKRALNGVDYKHDTVKSVIKSLGKVLSYSKDKGCYLVENDGKKLVVADLISAGNQDNARKCIDKCIEDGTYSVDVIVAMKMFTEGCDYPPLERCLIDGVRESHGTTIQMSGRTTRDFPDKLESKVTMLIQRDLNLDREDASHVLNKHLKLLVGCLSYANFFLPVDMRIKGERVLSDRERSEYVDPLGIVGDLVAQDNFKVEVIKAWSNRVKDDNEAKVSWDKRLEIMTQVCADELDGLGNEETAGSIAKRILKECAIALKTRDVAINIDDIDMEMLKEVDTTEFLSAYMSDILSSNDMKDFKSRVLRLMGKTFVLEEECVRKMKEVGGTNNQKWMQIRLSLGLSEYPSNPYVAYGYQNQREFFAKYFDRHGRTYGSFVTEEECVRKMKEVGGINDQKWRKIRKSLNLKGYPAHPYIIYGHKSYKEFFLKHFNGLGRFVSEEECVKKMKEVGADYAKKWIKMRKSLTLNNYPSHPHIVYKYKDENEFYIKHFDRVRIVHVFVSEEECVKKMKEVGVVCGNEWKVIRESELIDFTGYPSKPHAVYGYKSSLAFFAKHFNKTIRAFVSEEECMRKIKETGATCGNKWKEIRKLLDLNDYPCKPHNTYKYESEKEFFTKVRQVQLGKAS